MLDHLGSPTPQQAQSIKGAIAENRISLAIQNIHEINDFDRILYGECLSRLVDRDGTEQPASVFVPPLEAMGETPLLDQHVLNLVLDRLLAAAPSANYGCNISADNLADRAAWNAILKPLRDAEHLASHVVLELTETLALHDWSMAREMVAEAHDLGCRVALDDFGVGFASPRLLQAIDFDIVKIDKAFLHDVRRSADDHNSLCHLVGFATSFAPIVVVEGVETATQAALARAAGATHLQGYLLSTPIAEGRLMSAGSHGVGA